LDKTRIDVLSTRAAKSWRQLRHIVLLLLSALILVLIISRYRVLGLVCMRGCLKGTHITRKLVRKLRSPFAHFQEICTALHEGVHLRKNATFIPLLQLSTGVERRWRARAVGNQRAMCVEEFFPHLATLDTLFEHLHTFRNVALHYLLHVNHIPAPHNKRIRHLSQQSRHAIRRIQIP